MQTLSMPLNDDPMETDADRRGDLGEDIDIDIDFAGDHPLDEEDEYMSEGDIVLNDQTNTTVPQIGDTYNDDEMVDGGVHEEVLLDSTSVQDEDLQDAEDLIAAQPDGDDEIIDFRDDEPSNVTQSADAAHHEELIASEDPSNQVPEQQNAKIESEQNEGPAEHQSFESGENFHEFQETPELSRESVQGQPSHRDATIEPLKSNLQTPDQDSKLNLFHDDQERSDTPAPAASRTTKQAFSEDPDEISKVDEPSREAENTVTELIRQSVDQHELPPSSLDDYIPGQQQHVEQQEDLTAQTIEIHPVSVTYEGTELSLFRPATGEQDFLLEDQNLIDESITKLLAACKPVLGEDVYNHELVISVDDLDLEINEFAIDATIITVSQLNDIYLKLQHHDGIESPQNLHFNLYSRPIISGRLNHLRNAVAEGKGLSEVRYLPDIRGEEISSSSHARGKDEGTGENEEKSLHVKDVVEEQIFEEPPQTVDQEESSLTRLGPAAKSASALNNTESLSDVKKSNESTSHSAKVDKRTNEAISPNLEYQASVESKLVEPETQKTSHSVSGRNQEQKIQSPAFNEDEDGIIEYDDQEVVGSKSSSGSSTVKGDGDLTRHQTLSSMQQATSMAEDPLPETETSSHTLEGSFINESSDLLPADDDQDHGADGLEERENRNVEENYDYAKSGKDEFGYPADVEDQFGGENHEYDNTRDDNEYEASLEGYTQHQPDRNKDLNDDPIKLQPETVDVGKGESDNLRSQNIDLQESDDDAGVYLDPEEASGGTGQGLEDAENLEEIIEDPTIPTINHDQVDEFEDLGEAESHTMIQSKVPVEDEDEITFDDDNDDEEEARTKSFNFEPDQLPSPRSLKKRSRSHTDADDDVTANDPKEAKRIRSS